MYSGSVLRSESLDPQYYVRFSYEDERYNIHNAIAIYIRKYPKFKVVFNDYTDYILERMEVDAGTIENIKLLVGQTVFDYILATRVD